MLRVVEIGGSPIIATVFNIKVGDQQSTTTYTDGNGNKHVLITKCNSIETRTFCAGRHYQYVVAYQKMFPR